MIKIMTPLKMLLRLYFVTCALKDHNRTEPIGTNLGSFSGKRKTPMLTLVKILSIFSSACFKKKGHTKDNCRRLTQKDKASAYQEQKGKPSDQKGNFLDIVEVQTQHLSNCSCSFLKHILGPHDLLRTIGQINGSLLHCLFDTSSLYNFINDQLIKNGQQCSPIVRNIGSPFVHLQRDISLGDPPYEANFLLVTLYGSPTIER